MELTSGRFLLLCAVAVSLVNLSANARYRSIVIGAANVVFIGSFITAPLQLFGLAALLAIGYGGVMIVRRRNTWPVFATTLFVIVFAFLYLKHYSFVDFLPPPGFPYLILGLSYILFRIVHLAIDTASGDIEESVDLWTYFNYTCNFLAFSSGPIQRFQDYRDDLRGARPVDAAQCQAAFLRIATGYFKVLAVSAMANAVFLKLSPALLHSNGADASWLAACVRYAVVAATYTVFLYYNFSGFIDIVIGFGNLLGHRFPENFNHPFRAGNFLEFWSRWHMTLSNWLRDYVFNPLLKFLIGRFPAPRLAPAFGVLSFFVTFLLIGIWHGATPVFVIYGLMMGTGVSANKAFQLFVAAKLGRRRYRELCRQPLYLNVCRGLTFAYFAIGTTSLWIDIAGLSHVWHRLGAPGFLIAYACLSAAGAIALPALDAVQAAIRTAALALRVERWPAASQTFGLASLVLLTLAVNTLFNQPPEFVYRAF